MSIPSDCRSHLKVTEGTPLALQNRTALLSTLAADLRDVGSLRVIVTGSKFRNSF